PSHSQRTAGTKPCRRMAASARAARSAFASRSVTVSAFSTASPPSVSLRRHAGRQTEAAWPYPAVVVQCDLHRPGPYPNEHAVRGVVDHGIAPHLEPVLGPAITLGSERDDDRIVGARRLLDQVVD